MVGALRWGLPKDHPGSQTPWLPTLITGLETFTAYFSERFISEPLEKAPIPSRSSPSRRSSTASGRRRTRGSSASWR
ncbi:hypothetical protein GBA65_19870 [Rubrobacter marinus]|uniref:Uncharacterized protein n=1 Tax=Rubrobacter marinus TaxID=2653852 RepID=A0A6G8Q1S1_9ACTN|nr:hypothetical protein [Rubrobacter marinus]QIN80398.1 hypothetical protein GBA65_19870 [Rubrobacter marinus]